MQKNFDGQETQQNKKKEGDVTINTKPNKGKIINKDDGDYVDYEELK